MTGNVEKFVFLGVMLVVAFVGNSWTPAPPATEETALLAPPEAPVPLFVLSSPVAVAFPTSVALLPPEAAPAATSSHLALLSLLSESAPPQETAEAPAQGKVPVNLDLAALVSSEALSPPVFHRVSQTPAPRVAAQAALVADLATGEAYFSLNPDKRWPIASITKLMTATYALAHMDEEARFTLAEHDFLVADNAAAKILKMGDTYRLGDLLWAMLLYSSNEAAEAVANSYGRANFLAGMNNLASEWGLASTYFGDPTGLLATDQSTAFDLRKMALRIYEDYARVFEMTQARSRSITELNSGRAQLVHTINLLASAPGFLGGKTGYTDEAGGNLLTVFSHETRPVLAVVLGTGDRFGETENLMRWFTENFRLTQR